MLCCEVANKGSPTRIFLLGMIVSEFLVTDIALIRLHPGLVGLLQLGHHAVPDPPLDVMDDIMQGDLVKVQQAWLLDGAQLTGNVYFTGTR